jgi:hypothetical protein
MQKHLPFAERPPRRLLSGEITRGKCGLEVEPAATAGQIEDFPSEKQARAQP